MHRDDSASPGVLPNAQRDHPALGIASFVGNLVMMSLLSAAVRELVDRDYPLGEVMLLLLGFGLGCGIQQWLLTISFRYAEASLLAPFEYLAMVFAAIVGFIFWDEIPLLTTWAGAAVIAGSGLFIFRRRQREMRPATRVEPVVMDWNLTGHTVASLCSIRQLHRSRE